MNELIMLVKQYGIRTALIICSFGLIGYLVRYLVMTVVNQLEDSRKDYKEVITNHINHNTQAMNEMVVTMKSLQDYMKNHDDNAERRTERIVEAIGNLREFIKA